MVEVRIVGDDARLGSFAADVSGCFGRFIARIAIGSIEGDLVRPAVGVGDFPSGDTSGFQGRRLERRMIFGKSRLRRKRSGLRYRPRHSGGGYEFGRPLAVLRLGGESGVRDAAGRSVGSSERGRSEYVDFAIGCLVSITIGLQRDRDDPGVAQRAELASIGHAVTVEILPHAELCEVRVVCIESIAVAGGKTL